MSTETETETFKFSVKLEFPDEVSKEAIEAAVNTLNPSSVAIRRNMGARRKLEESDKAAIVAARQSGASYKVLAAEFGDSVAAINKVLRDAGLTKQWLSAEARAEQEAARQAAEDDSDEDEDEDEEFDD